MKTTKRKNHNTPTMGRHRTAGRRNGSRGAALIISLLLMTLLVAMTLSMVISVTSDTLISGYYRNFRSSFYAGDSGLNIARQNMLNQLVGDIPATFNASAQPIPAGSETAVVSNLLTSYGSTTSLNSGQAANSWAGKFTINATGTTLGTAGTPAPGVTAQPVSCSISNVTGTVTNYASMPPGGYPCSAPPTGGSGATAVRYTVSYVYPYTISATGQSLANEQQNLQDSGTLTLNVSVAPAGSTTTSFAGWGMFIDQFPICNGSTLVGGTITGPVFTNGAWTFGTTSSGYTFTDKVGSANPNFGYQFGNCYQSASPNYSSGGQSITPNFQAGFALGQAKLALPANSINQEQAVVDGVGGTTLNTSEMQTNLRNVNGTVYPTTTPSSGVYLPYSQTTSGGVTTRTMTGGGILVEGNAAVTLTPSTVGGHSAQVYTIVQGGTTTTVTVDMTAMTTTIQSGSTTTVVAGVPENYTSGTPSPATMLYVDGNITALSGPAQGVPAIQNAAAVTVTAADNITITGDLLYSKEPVTTTQNQVVNGVTVPSADTLIPANNSGQVLGIYTAGGNVNLANSQSNGNLEIDASVATISSTGSGGIVNTGSAINNLTIVGGRIQNTIQNINATTRNVWFDRRFAAGNFAPPWFPSTTVTPTSTDTSSSVITSVQRTQWVNTSAQ